ncbi:MAG TPA: HAMP domain-containing sensor histidine kinase [Casimicrobiaceae bacterium]|nr:HAMP domain-containing sensor histidine kinase [Casimicrobiaceae bacterium]
MPPTLAHLQSSHLGARDELSQGAAARAQAAVGRERESTAPRALDGGASLASLRELHHLRSIAMGGQAVAISVAYATNVALPYGAMLLVLGALAVFDLVVARRVRHGMPASQLEVFGNLMVDVGAFTTMLLLSGGTANPFALLYLLKVALIGLLLPPLFAVGGTLVTLIGFALCVELASPLKLIDGHDMAPALLTAGRYVSFALTAVMIAWFVGRVSSALRSQQGLLEEAARKAVNDEALLRIGTIATGAAHELGSPLMSMGMVVSEWKRQGRIDDFDRDVGILASQIAACKDALASLRAAARGARLDDAVQPLDRMLLDLVERCRATHPHVDLRCSLADGSHAPTIAGDAAFKQAILILLDNAADACTHAVDVSARWSADAMEIAIGDDGPGIPTARLPELGRTFFTTKAPGRGNGLGVMLAAATAARLGGSIKWRNQEAGGALARLAVPLSSLKPTLRAA